MDKRDLLYRAMVLLLSTALAAGVIWRGHIYIDASGSGGILTPIMCSVAGILCFMTGVSLAARGRESEAHERSRA